MPPCAETTKTSWLPSYSPVNAMSDPSGENIGLVSIPTSVVRRRALPPFRSTIHRSPAYEKQICVALTVGSRRGSGGGAGGGAGDAGKGEERYRGGRAQRHGLTSGRGAYHARGAPAAFTHVRA